MKVIAREGVRLQGPVTDIAGFLLVANAAAVFQISNFAQQVGTKSLRLKKLFYQNAAAGALWISIGTGAGAGYADLIPPVRSLNNLNGGWLETELPDVESFADVTAWIDVLVAGGAMLVQLEVEEIG